MNTKIIKLTPEEEARVEAERQVVFERLKNVPPGGIEIDHLGKKILVLNSVFWPREDSKELIRKMVIKPGDEVLDMCTGSGVIAIHIAEKGAKKVVALDINPEAIKNVEVNAERFGFTKIIDARVSDAFSALKTGEQFDVITCNPPFSNKPISDKSQSLVEQTIKDDGYVLHKKLFASFEKYLKPGGKIFISDANFGNLDDLFSLAEQNRFTCQLIGTNPVKDTVMVFYVFELTRK